MADKKSYLCVGGPLGGRRYEAKIGAGFCVPRLTETGIGPNPTAKDYMPNAAVEARFTEYQHEVFHTPQGDVSFWTPKGQTPMETINILLGGYEHACKQSR